MDLKTKYLGLELRNPLIVSSSGLTNSVEKIEKLEKLGAAAVVVKSIFEEQINHEIGKLSENEDYPEAADYIRYYTTSNNVQAYLELISGAKEKVDIPVIASVNCISSANWIDFTKQIQDAGADAIELNIFYMATDANDSSESYENRYVDIVRQLKQSLAIPVAVKLADSFTNKVRLVDQLKNAKANGVVLFNRFYQPDIDIDKLEITSADLFSKPEDISNTMRWVGIISHKVEGIDIAASTGVHGGADVIKMLLSGATVVQVCSTLYKNGIDQLPTILEEVETWMAKKQYDSVGQFRGKLNYQNIKDPSLYERAQFMKYYSSHE